MRNLDFLDAAHEVSRLAAHRVYLGLDGDGALLEVVVGPKPAVKPTWPPPHATLASVHEESARGDDVIVVSEGVRGPTLEEIVDAAKQTGRGLPMTAIARMLTDVADALAWLKRAGRPHGALALRSARVDARGRTRIVDLPLAWLGTRTQSRAPDASPSFADDVFALGTVGGVLAEEGAARSSPLLSSLPVSLARAVCDDPPSVGEIGRALAYAAGTTTHEQVARAVADLVEGFEPAPRRARILAALDRRPGRRSDVGFEDIARTEPLASAMGQRPPGLEAARIGDAIVVDVLGSRASAEDGLVSLEDVATIERLARPKHGLDPSGTERLSDPSGDVFAVSAETTVEGSGPLAAPSTVLGRRIKPVVSSDEEDELRPGLELGRYRIDGLIGKGGLAEVYRATMRGPLGFEKRVAIKRIKPRFAHDPSVAETIIDEARITMLVSHPNVAQVFELGEEAKQLFLVMELVDGEPLSSLVARVDAVGSKLAAYIVSEMLLGLHAAHVQRLPSGDPACIIHRDVSPANVLLTRDGRVKVIDFGIARAVGRLEETQAGIIKGKLRYLAPEVVARRRFGTIDHRVDVFAAGVVLWELVAGRRLFERDAPDVVMKAIADMPVPDLYAERLCDDVLARIVARALCRPVDDRFPSADAFAQELRRWLFARDPAFAAAQLAAFLKRASPSKP